MRKGVLLGLIFAFIGLTQIGSAFDYRRFKVDPNDQVMITLLSMVMNDLEMCRQQLKGKFVDNLLSIGHLNNAQSALKRTDLDMAYEPLRVEILQRISKIKFYVVMNDLNNVGMRLNQLIAVVRAVMGASAGEGILYPGGNTNPYPGNFIPVQPEVPPNGPGNQGGFSVPGNQYPVIPN